MIILINPSLPHLPIFEYYDLQHATIFVSRKQRWNHDTKENKEGSISITNNLGRCNRLICINILIP